MKATVKNLRTLGPGGAEAARVMLCPACGAEWSANAGDYWDYPDDYVVDCSACGHDRLVICARKTVYEEL